MIVGDVEVLVRLLVNVVAISPTVFHHLIRPTEDWKVCSALTMYSYFVLVSILAGFPVAASWAFQLPLIPHSHVPIDQVSTNTRERNLFPSNPSTSRLGEDVHYWIQNTFGVPPAMAAEMPAPPTKEEVNLLRQAFASFYGTGRDFDVAEDLLTKTITAWERQAPDERAGLYRVRGDCKMAMLKPTEAILDYTQTIALIESPGGENADPAELPAAL